MLKAACGRTIITPAAGTRMGGYGARKTPATGVHDDLYATCFLLESDPSGPLCILSLDVLGLSDRDVSAVKAAIREKAGIPPAKVMLASTQTHSGPDVLFNLEDQDKVADYAKALPGRVAELVASLTGRLVPATVGAAAVEKPGWCINRVDPDGPIDDTVGVIRIDDDAGQPMGAIVNYTCHPTVLGSDNFLTSRDYCGCVCEATAAGLGEQAIVGFVHGAAGNINPAFRGTFADAEKMGQALGDAALNAFREARVSADITLKSISAKVNLPMRPPLDTPADEAKRNWDQAVERYEKLVAEGAPAPDRQRAHVEFEYACELYHIAREYGGTDSLAAEFQIFAIGDCALVAFPGEMFVETGLAIRSASPFGHTFITDITNGFVGYVPPQRYLNDGVYEARLARWSMLAEEAEEIVRTSMISMLEELWNESREQR